MRLKHRWEFPVGSWPMLAQPFIDGPDRVIETGGKNKHPMISEWNKAVGGKSTDPYCMAFLSALARKAAQIHPPTGHVFPYDVLNWKGAIAIWQNTDSQGRPLWKGHTFGLLGRLTKKTPSGLIVVGFETFEGNTDLTSMDRDGEGCYRLKRMLSTLQSAHPRLYFVRTDVFPGGSWW
jgi:hypothetical protein